MNTETIIYKLQKDKAELIEALERFQRIAKHTDLIKTRPDLFEQTTELLSRMN